MDSKLAGRFAPSPTGRMHLGNVMTALVSWLAARRRGARWILRIEDLDPQRSRLEYARLIEDDLRWLGLEWDEGGLDNGEYSRWCQSQRHDLYQAALEHLRDKGLLYPCRCTRADILATQAPHATDGRRVYAGTCRPAVIPSPWKGPQEGCNTRLYVPHQQIVVDDVLQGRHIFDPAASGDPVMRRADGAWAYQLAVVVDDALMGVGEVVRGADLLESSALQQYIASLLADAPWCVPTSCVRNVRWMHIPLVCNAAGQRLSKRDGSMAMDALRARYSPEQLIGHLAHLAGLRPDDSPCRPSDLL